MTRMTSRSAFTLLMLVVAITGLLIFYETLAVPTRSTPTVGLLVKPDLGTFTWARPQRNVPQPENANMHAPVNISSSPPLGVNIVSKQCQIILRGNTREIGELRKSEDFSWRDQKNDTDIATMAANCSLLRSRFRFPPYFAAKVSAEELAFPIAYSVLAYENVNQILVLLSAIYRHHNIHCVHIDAKASKETYNAMLRASECFPNIIVAKARQKVIYAHISRLLADIECMKELLKVLNSSYDWKYLINLCSQDFPTRTNLEVVRQLKEFQGFNSIGGYLDISDQIRQRTQYVWKLPNAAPKKHRELRPIRTKHRHAPPPHNMTVVKNLAYNFYTRGFLRWALVESEVGRALLEWSRDTYSPDEHFWLMLHRYPGAPGGSRLANGYQLARKIVWSNNNKNISCHGEWRHGICVIGAEDVWRVSEARDLFINKFDIALDGAGPTCIRQLLDERATVPNSHRGDGNVDKIPDIPPKVFFEKELISDETY